MCKQYLCLSLVSIVFACFSLSAGASELQANDDVLLNEKISSVGFGKMFQKDPKKEITDIFGKLDRYTERNNIKKIKELFSEDFVNNDGFDYDMYMKSVKNGFSSYENRTVTTKINDINITDNYATVYVTETGEAQTKDIPEGLKEKGLVLASAEVCYCLTKQGNKWKITTAHIYDESCNILYGLAKNIYFSINTPSSIKSGTEYSALLSFPPLNGTLVLASLSSENITYPMKSPDEPFKTVKNDGMLERVFIADSEGYNQYVVATIGLTRLRKISDTTDLNLGLAGSAYVIKRVNVVRPLEKKLFSNAKRSPALQAEAPVR